MYIVQIITTRPKVDVPFFGEAVKKIPALSPLIDDMMQNRDYLISSNGFITTYITVSNDLERKTKTIIFKSKMEYDAYKAGIPTSTEFTIARNSYNTVNNHIDMIVESESDM